MTTLEHLGPREHLAVAGLPLLALAIVLTLALCRAASNEPNFGRCRYCGMIIRGQGLCRKCRERRERDERAADETLRSGLAGRENQEPEWR